MPRGSTLLKWRYGWSGSSAPADPKGKYFSLRLQLPDDPLRHAGLLARRGWRVGFSDVSARQGRDGIYLQIASSRKFSVRCGATTRQSLFRASSSWMATCWCSVNRPARRKGIEVQCSPGGTEVITVIAQNAAGSGPQIDRDDLIKLTYKTPASPAGALVRASQVYLNSRPLRTS